MSLPEELPFPIIGPDELIDFQRFHFLRPRRSNEALAPTAKTEREKRDITKGQPPCGKRCTYCLSHVRWCARCAASSIISIIVMRSVNVDLPVVGSSTSTACDREIQQLRLHICQFFLRHFHNSLVFTAATIIPARGLGAVAAMPSHSTSWPCRFPGSLHSVSLLDLDVLIDLRQPHSSGARKSTTILLLILQQYHYFNDTTVLYYCSDTTAGNPTRRVEMEGRGCTRPMPHKDTPSCRRSSLRVHVRLYIVRGGDFAGAPSIREAHHRAQRRIFTDTLNLKKTWHESAVRLYLVEDKPRSHSVSAD